ncbi:MAG: glycerol-3-phosphate 1-O-acyltransferase PlsY [Candidatus Acidiferrales bacterium]
MPLGLLSLVAAYLLGALPFGYLLVRLKKGEDVRATGSGSMGATNVARAAGLVIGLSTLLLDLAKGYGAVELAARLTAKDPLWTGAAALAAILGHSYPVFLGFRGGKSVATGLGAFARLTPLAVLPALGIWVVVVALWRYVSLGSVLASAAYPLFAFALYRPPLETNLATVLCASIIILRHRSNLERLVSGTEPKFHLKGKP